MADDRQRLLAILTRKSFIYSKEPTFKLASGKMSSYYVNCKKTTYDPEGIDLIGKAVFDRMISFSPDAVGGLTLGADPIAVAAAGESFRRGKPIKAFVVRKEIKEHGTKAPIEGDLRKGESVVLIEDVITTGGSALKAFEALDSFGVKVLAVIALVDRQEGGREAIEAKGLRVESIFTKDKIMELYKSGDCA